MCTYLERFREHLAHLLLAQVARAAEDGRILRLALLLALAAARTRADCAAQDLRPPPPAHGAVAVVQAQHRIGVGEGPRVRAFREAGDDIERRQGDGGACRRGRRTDDGGGGC